MEQARAFSLPHGGCGQAAWWLKEGGDWEALERIACDAVRASVSAVATVAPKVLAAVARGGAGGASTAQQTAERLVQAAAPLNGLRDSVGAARATHLPHICLAQRTISRTAVPCPPSAPLTSHTRRPSLAARATASPS